MAKNTCSRCKGIRLVDVCAKCSDMCFMHLRHLSVSRTYYVPADVGMGDDMNYVEFSYCLSCGQIQGDFPIINDPDVSEWEPVHA